MMRGLIFAGIFAMPLGGGRIQSALYAHHVGMPYLGMLLWALITSAVLTAALMVAVHLVSKRTGGRIAQRLAKRVQAQDVAQRIASPWRIAAWPGLPCGFFIAIALALHSEMTVVRTYALVTLANWGWFIAYQKLATLGLFVALGAIAASFLWTQRERFMPRAAVQTA
jgi:hypothetical protein